MQDLANATGVKVACCIGGRDIHKQCEDVVVADVVVATYDRRMHMAEFPAATVHRKTMKNGNPQNHPTPCIQEMIQSLRVLVPDEANVF